MEGCRIEVGDRVKQRKRLLIGSTGKRKWIKKTGIVEKVEYNELSKGYSIYFRTKNNRGYIGAASNLELLEKDVAKLEGNQVVMEFQGGAKSEAG